MFYCIVLWRLLVAFIDAVFLRMHRLYFMSVMALLYIPSLSSLHNVHITEVTTHRRFMIRQSAYSNLYIRMYAFKRYPLLRATTSTRGKQPLHLITHSRIHTYARSHTLTYTNIRTHTRAYTLTNAHYILSIANQINLIHPLIVLTRSPNASKPLKHSHTNSMIKRTRAHANTHTHTHTHDTHTHIHTPRSRLTSRAATPTIQYKYEVCVRIRHCS